MTASVYLKFKLQMMQFTRKPKTLETLVPTNLYLFLSCSHWKCTSCLQKHIVFVCLYVLLSCMLCFHGCTNECFHLILDVHIVRTFENRIPSQTFEKYHNVSYSYVNYIKSEASFISRRGAWFLKPFVERVEENHIYHLVKPNSTVKTGTVYRACNVCLKAKFQILT